MRHGVSTLIAVLVVSVAVVGCENAAADPAGGPPREGNEPKSTYRTTGPVAEAPIQVGCWTPLKVETPPYVFPMVYARWRTGMTVKEYADKIIAEIESRPTDQPIWLQTHAWFGNYKPRDPDNVIAHEKDATPQGTPAIWPDKGLEIWRTRHNEFLRRLHEAGCRLDAWPLDNETKVSMWAHNYRGKDVFINMVRDPRWDSEPIMGVFKTGSHFMSRKEIEAADDPNRAAHAPHRPPGRLYARSRLR